MLDKRIEIAVRVQQVMPVFDAPDCNRGVDRLAYSNTEPLQHTKVFAN